MKKSERLLLAVVFLACAAAIPLIVACTHNKPSSSQSNHCDSHISPTDIALPDVPWEDGESPTDHFRRQLDARGVQYEKIMENRR